MNMLRVVVLVLACLSLAACRSDPSIDLLESELRSLEDQLYLLDDELEQKCAELASCRRENSTLRRGTSQKEDLGTSVLQPARDSDPSRTSEPDDAPGLTPPTVEPGVLAPPEVEFPSGPSELPPPNLQGAAQSPAEAVQVSAQVIEDAGPVTQIKLNSRLTGGYDFDGKPGDEGVLVVIEPQDDEGHYVARSAPVSIVVLDKTQSGAAARVARWDFDASETAGKLRRSLLGRGIHLELPWPNEPPQSKQLQVYTRYMTDDGSKLQADREIQVELTPRAAQGWTVVSPLRGPRSGWAKAGHSAEEEIDARGEPPARLSTEIETRPLTVPPVVSRFVRPDNDPMSATSESSPAVDSPTARTPANDKRPSWRPFR